MSLNDMCTSYNTNVIYTTDNVPHQNTWPDAGTIPFRSEKNTNWEGAYRVPALIRWPGRISGFDGGSGRQSPQAARSAIFASSPFRKPAIAPIPVRTEERRVGTEGVSKGRSRWSP